MATTTTQATIAPAVTDTWLTAIESINSEDARIQVIRWDNGSLTIDQTDEQGETVEYITLDAAFVERLKQMLVGGVQTNG